MIALCCTDSVSLGEFLASSPTDQVLNHYRVNKTHKRLRLPLAADGHAVIGPEKHLGHGLLSAVGLQLIRYLC